MMMMMTHRAIMRLEQGATGLFVCLCFLAPSAVVVEGDHGGGEARLPEKIANNAVAWVEIEGQPVIFSFLGLEEGKTYEDTSLAAFEYRLVEKTGRRLTPVPGGEGRLAGVAATVGQKIYIFGGYTVDAEGGEVSSPLVHSFDPQSHVYRERKPMPTPVDDSVALVYKDRYVYLVSGWHDKGNVSLVQVYDTEKDVWFGATDYPGSPVFGHSGGIVGDRLIIADGVREKRLESGKRTFEITDEVYQGIIDSADPSVIKWGKLPPHPGKPRYRMAAVGSGQKGGLVVFAGGTGNPYNYNGIGYDGVPSEPSDRVFGYQMDRGEWLVYAPKETATMDHRGLLEIDGVFYTVGGMVAGQEVSDGIFSFRLRERGEIGHLEN